MVLVWSLLGQMISSAERGQSAVVFRKYLIILRESNHPHDSFIIVGYINTFQWKNKQYHCNAAGGGGGATDFKDMPLFYLIFQCSRGT